MREKDKLQLAFRIPNLWNPMDMFLAWKIGRYIHVELVFPEEYIKGKNSFSSRGRRNPTGCKFRKINYKNKLIKWDFITLFKKYQDNILQIRENCLSVVSMAPEYDYIGAIFNAGLGVDVNDKKKYWCSEVVAIVLGLTNYELTPVELYEYFVK